MYVKLKNNKDFMIGIFVKLFLAHLQAVSFHFVCIIQILCLGLQETIFVNSLFCSNPNQDTKQMRCRQHQIISLYKIKRKQITMRVTVPMQECKNVNALAHLN